MPATRQEVIESVRDGVQHVEWTFNELSEGDLETPVEVDGREWTARDLLALMAGRGYVYDTIIRMVEFDQMPDMFEYGPGHLNRMEKSVTMTRDSFDEGAQSMARRPGAFDLSDPEWEYNAATPDAGKSTRELLNEFRQVHENFIDRLQDMPDDLLEKPSPVGTSNDTLADTLKARSGDFLDEHATRIDEVIAERSR